VCHFSLGGQQWLAQLELGTARENLAHEVLRVITATVPTELGSKLGVGPSHAREREQREHTAATAPFRRARQARSQKLPNDSYVRFHGASKLSLK